MLLIFLMIVVANNLNNLYIHLKPMVTWKHNIDIILFAAGGFGLQD